MRQARQGGGLTRRLEKLALGAALALLAVAVHAQGVSWDDGLRGDAPQRYTVVRGDTLWDIAGRFLREPWQWPEVWRVNPQIDNPHLIYPGDIVYLHDCGGRPCLGLERGQGVVRLSPRMRTSPYREAIEPIPLEAVRAFLREHRVVTDPEALDALAFVVAGDDGRLISGAGDRFYARGNVAGGGRVGVYRRGERYRDAVSGELLGLALEKVAEARRLRQDDDIAVMEVVASREEVRSEDILLPLEDRQFPSAFLPRAPGREIDGRILAVPGGVRFIGWLQVVALDRGTRDGLAPGHVLRVEQRGERVSDPRSGETLQLPGEEAGLVMVFRPFDKVSYGLVMWASRPLSVGDRVHDPRRDLDTARR